MAKLTDKEFEKMHGVKAGTIRVHIKRGKLQRDVTGLIDTDDPINKIYLRDLQISKANEVQKEPEKAKQVQEKQPKEVVTPKKIKPSKEDQYIIDLDLRKKVADAELKEHESALRKMQLEKQAGNLLPVDLVKNIVGINIQGIWKNVDSELDNMLALFITDRTDLANHSKKLKELLHIMIRKTEEETLFEIENAIDEFSESRGRGERR